MDIETEMPDLIPREGSDSESEDSPNIESEDMFLPLTINEIVTPIDSDSDNSSNSFDYSNLTPRDYSNSEEEEPSPDQEFYKISK